MYGVYLKPSQGWHEDCFKIRKETFTEASHLNILAWSSDDRLEDVHAMFDVARSATSVKTRRSTIKDAEGNHNTVLDLKTGPSQDDDDVDVLGEFLSEPGGKGTIAKIGVT